MYPMNNEQQPLIGIVTVTFNSGRLLPDFLRSLETQTYQNFRLCVGWTTSRRMILLRAVASLERSSVDSDCERS